MRIQHNITAMNSYRNYTNNTGALAKNLEKLSSGYKINRAGDDAAGLAISEKMRAQISGLKQAQSNVKDGISLVKTAEGALQEVQDMMNRMVTLATQSANGTYDNDVDRANLQKEVESLKSEIDRIADSSNFNGTKLLDGSLDAKGGVAGTELKFTDAQALALHSDGAHAPIYHKEATTNAKTSFKLDFSNMDSLNYVADANDTAVDAYELRLSGFVGKNVLQNSEGDAIQFGLEAGEQVTGKSFAETIMKAIGEDGLVYLNTDGDDDTTAAIEYKVTNNGDGTLSFEMTDAGYKTATELYDKAVAAGVEDAADTNHDAFRGNYDVNVFIKNDTDAANQTGFAKAVLDYGNNIPGTTVVNEGSAAANTQLFSATVKFDGMEIKDGSGIQLGNESYVFALTKETLNAEYGEGVKVVDLTDLDAEKISAAFNKDASDTDQGEGDSTVMTEVFNRLSKAAEGNEMFTLSMQASGTFMQITEKAGNTSDIDLTGAKAVGNAIRTFSKVETVETVTEGAALKLQIGDTAESYNQIDVSVQDMHVKALGIGDIDISTQEGAAKAIETVKTAINTVSSTRGDLGAIQNRLEHTTKNLQVMTENIQDAESTIRDVDIADEMTTYTKNNILLQSAQAMLAQANQMPQGVLQLLQ